MEQKKTAGRGMAVLLSAALVPTMGVPATAFADEREAVQEQAAVSQEAPQRANAVDELLAQDATASTQEEAGQVDGEQAVAPEIEVSTQEQLRAAVDDNSVTKITLTSDIVMTEEWVPARIAADRVLVIDGAGHTISGMVATKSLRGPNGTGIAGDGGSADYYCGFIGDTSGTVTIQNLTFSHAEVDIKSLAVDKKSTGSSILGTVVGNNNGKLVLNNVAVESSVVRGYSKVGGLVGFSQDKGTAEINKCVVRNSNIVLEADGTDPEACFSGVIVGYDGNNLTTVNGIALEGNTTTIDESVAWGMDFQTDEFGTRFVDVSGNRYGLTCETYAKGSNGMDAVPMSFSVDGYRYESLNDAFAAAQDGDTVKLLHDADMTEIAVVSGKSIALDLNGKTVSNSKDIYAGSNVSLVSVRNGGELVVSGNGTMKAKKNDCYVFDVQRGSKLTIEDGTFVGNISVVYLVNGNEPSPGTNELVINGGDFSIQQLSTGEDGYRFLLNCRDIDYQLGKAVIAVNGGVFHGFNPGDNLAEGEGTNFLADGATVTVDDQTVPPTYSVTPKYVPPVTPPSKPDTDVEVEQKPDGSTVTTETKPDGSQTVTTETPDGTSSQVEKDADGNVTSTEVSVSDKAAASGKVELPIDASKPAADAADAPVVEVKVPASVAPDAPVKVTVPVAKDEGTDPNRAVVVVAVDAEGNERVLPKCFVDADGNVAFEATGDVTIKVVDASPSFPDVEGEWYGEDGTADFVGARDILQGMPQADGSLLFDGGASTTRAMFVTMLHRLESEMAPAAPEGFDDIDGDWFADAAAWGAAADIVNGYGDGSNFGGNDSVTREQMAVFAMRYAQWLGLDTSARADLSAFADAAAVSPFASEAVSWAAAEGILRGHADGSGRIDPSAGATRAEASAVIMRLVGVIYE